MVAELYRWKEVVGTDNDKEKIVCTPKEGMTVEVDAIYAIALRSLALRNCIT